MQWKIYDAYIEEVQIQEKNKERQKAASSSKDGDKNVKKVLLMESQVRQETRSTVPPAALAVIVIIFPVSTDQRHRQSEKGSQDPGADGQSEFKR